MRVCLCVNFFRPSVGGAEIVCGVIADHLAKKHDVYVITRRISTRSQLDLNNLHVIEYIPGDVAAFWNKVNTIKPDVLFIYSDVFDFFRHVITTVPKYRLIVALCGANWIYKNRSFANIFNRHSKFIERIICHSKSERDYRLCSDERLHKKLAIIPNGVHLSEFDNNNLTRIDLLPIMRNKKWILNVSNFFPGKGQEHLVDIIAQLPSPQDYVYIQLNNDIEFKIGEHLEIEWKKKVALKLKPLNVHVEHIKNATRKEVIGFFKQSNLFAFTSEKEIAPIVLLEAMASELPWIATDVGNARELRGGKYIPAIKDQKYHSYFDDRVKTMFSNTIVNMLGDPNINKEGRTQIENELNWDRILDRYSDLIEI